MKKTRFILSIIMLICWAGTFASTKNEPEPYDQMELAVATAAYERALAIPLNESERVLQMSDSLFRVGAQQENYMVQITALRMKVRVYKITRNWAENKKVSEMLRDLSLKNNNMREYFHDYYSECNALMDENSADALLMAQQMIKEAKEYDIPDGLVWGHIMLGEINLYYRDDFLEATDKLQQGIDFALKYPDCPVNLVRQYAALAKAHNESRQYDKAKEALYHAQKMMNTGSDSMEVQLAAIDIAYNQRVPLSEYKVWHDALTGNPYYQSMISEDTKLFYQIRWLIVSGHYDEALRLTDKLQLHKDRHLMRCDVFRATHNFEAFLAENDSLESVRDSISHRLSEEIMIVIDREMKNFELQQEAMHSRQVLNTTITLFVLLLLIIGIVLAYYHNRRRMAHLRNMEMVNKKLNIANETKTRFIQNMTHELHTPLNAINGFATLLASHDMEFDDESKREMMKGISDSSLELTRLIDDIVMLTNYESTEEEPLKADFDVAETIVLAMRNVTPPDATKVKYHYVNDMPECFAIHSNAKMLQRLLEELLNNAIKFTERGEICVSTNLCDDGNTLMLAVTDTGKGIPADKSQVVFERFEKLDEFIPGTGLGLSLCRAISNRLHGSIQLDTTYQSGARFVFTMPVPKHDNATE